MLEILKQADFLLKDINNNISLLANASAYLNQILDDINWVGFYLANDDYLYLGPFQGKVACDLINISDGVCGFAYRTEQTINVPNVHKFKGHIACDPNSNSELVIPLKKDGIIFGVLDVDSPIFNRFDKETTNLIINISKLIEKYYTL